MNAQQIAQLAIALAPVAQQIVVEGGKLIATYKATLTSEEMTRALELSKSANWPAIDFAR